MTYQIEPMTKEEFVEMLMIMHSRSTEGEVLGCKLRADIGNVDKVHSFTMVAFGRLCVDDVDDPVTRENGMSSTPLYPLDEIDTWKPGLFEKLSKLHWWIDPEDEINTLDVLAGIKE